MLLGKVAYRNVPFGFQSAARELAAPVKPEARAVAVASCTESTPTQCKAGHLLAIGQHMRMAMPQGRRTTCVNTTNRLRQVGLARHAPSASIDKGHSATAVAPTIKAVRESSGLVCMAII